MKTRRWILAIWLAALAVSYAVRAVHPGHRVPADDARSIQVAEIGGDHVPPRAVTLTYFDLAPQVGDPDARAADPVGSESRAVGPFVPSPATIVLLHGSPGSKADMAAMARALAAPGTRRVIAPDLPGFGASSRRVADYSIAAHARYVWQLLDALDVERVHVVGFSLGGGVALEMVHRAPERIASLTLLSSIGAQEYELLGDYQLNHALHGAQLSAIWLATYCVPHFGLLDRWPLDLPYARNFFDTDQRPLRGYLRAYQGPALIVHGENDPLVPAAAAREHHRLLPQSELVMLSGSHFYAFTQPQLLAARIGPFIDSAHRGEARTRATAGPGRLAATSPLLDEVEGIATEGLARAILLALVLLGTLLSEDLALVTAGLMVAHGRVDFASAAAAGYAGVLLGDLGLYALGRWFGRRALGRAPWSWILREHDVEDARHWYRRRGSLAVFVGRFLPGARVATYFVAGLARARLGVFAGTLAVAAAIWVPLLVGFAALTGDAAGAFFRRLSMQWLPAGLFGALLVVAIVRVLIPLSTWRGRRLLIGGLRRRSKWEFWPLQLFYIPVAAYIAWLAIRHRSLSLVTAVNPGMPAGGLIGESKHDILGRLSAGNPDRVAPHVLLPGAASPDQRWEMATQARATRGWSLPLVVKPDVGQRGEGVAVVRDEDELRRRIHAAHRDLLLQQYVPGVEFGVFYVRHPAQEAGRIFSITEKRMPAVVGDGRNDLETLILADERAVCLARVYLTRNADRLHQVPAAGERVQLVELGTHCRGAIFLDGRPLWTAALESEIDRISRGFPGFCFGRYDVRCADAAALQRGEFQVIELNGLTSEATHIYDPSARLLHAWSTLCQQWRLAYEIAAENRRRGSREATVHEVLQLLRSYRRQATDQRPDSVAPMKGTGVPSPPNSGSCPST